MFFYDILGEERGLSFDDDSPASPLRNPSGTSLSASNNNTLPKGNKKGIFKRVSIS